MGRSRWRRESISITVTTKYHEEERLQSHARYHPSRLDVRPVRPAARLPNHVTSDAHRDAAVVNAQSVDARLAVGRLYHVCHAGCEIGFCQSFHYRPFPPVLDAVHLGQMALIVPTYVTRDTRTGREKSPRHRLARLVRPF